MTPPPPRPPCESQPRACPRQNSWPCEHLYSGGPSGRRPSRLAAPRACTGSCSGHHSDGAQADLGLPHPLVGGAAHAHQQRAALSRVQRCSGGRAAAVLRGHRHEQAELGLQLAAVQAGVARGDGLRTGTPRGGSGRHAMPCHTIAGGHLPHPTHPPPPGAAACGPSGASSKGMPQ